MGAKSDTPDFEVARIAAQQHGVVTRRQLEHCGCGSKAITIRVRKGQLNRVHHGVYAVGHRGLSLHGRFMAAVLACGEGAVLSHGSAAVLWKLLYPIDGPVHVSVPTTSGRKTSLRHPPPSNPSARGTVSLALLYLARRRARETASSVAAIIYRHPKSTQS
jgi:hypothetical protein